MQIYPPNCRPSGKRYSFSNVCRVPATLKSTHKKKRVKENKKETPEKQISQNRGMTVLTLTAESNALWRCSRESNSNTDVCAFHPLQPPACRTVSNSGLRLIIIQLPMYPWQETVIFTIQYCRCSWPQNKQTALTLESWVCCSFTALSTHCLCWSRWDFHPHGDPKGIYWQEAKTSNKNYIYTNCQQLCSLKSLQ